MEYLFIDFFQRNPSDQNCLELVFWNKIFYFNHFLQENKIRFLIWILVFDWNYFTWLRTFTLIGIKVTFFKTPPKKEN